MLCTYSPHLVPTYDVMWKFFLRVAEMGYYRTANLKAALLVDLLKLKIPNCQPLESTSEQQQNLEERVTSYIRENHEVPKRLFYMTEQVLVSLSIITN